MSDRCPELLRNCRLNRIGVSDLTRGPIKSCAFCGPVAQDWLLVSVHFVGNTVQWLHAWALSVSTFAGGDRVMEYCTVIRRNEEGFTEGRLSKLADPPLHALTGHPARKYVRSFVMLSLHHDHTVRV